MMHNWPAIAVYSHSIVEAIHNVGHVLVELLDGCGERKKEGEGVCFPICVVPRKREGGGACFPRRVLGTGGSDLALLRNQQM